MERLALWRLIVRWIARCFFFFLRFHLVGSGCLRAWNSFLNFSRVFVSWRLPFLVIFRLVISDGVFALPRGSHERICRASCVFSRCEACSARRVPYALTLCPVVFILRHASLPLFSPLVTVVLPLMSTLLLHLCFVSLFALSLPLTALAAFFFWFFLVPIYLSHLRIYAGVVCSPLSELQAARCS